MRYLWGALLIILGESVSLVVFAALRRTQDPDSISAANNNEPRLDTGEDVRQGSADGQEREPMIDKKRKPDDGSRRRWAIGKGMLERLTMVVGLLGGFPHILTVIGALKIGTRLQDETDHISNTYFLTGNLVSILLAVTYAIILRWLWS